jgi:hypothetical protein
MELAYKAEYEQTPISVAQLLDKYDITLADIPNHREWHKEGEPAPIVKPTRKKKQKVIDKVLASIEVKQEVVIQQEVLPTIVPSPPPVPVTTATEDQLAKIANFKELALDHCITFMSQDAKFAEVKEFKDIVAIVDSLEKSYQKVDPDAGKPTINILVQNLMERFSDDC